MVVGSGQSDRIPRTAAGRRLVEWIDDVWRLPSSKRFTEEGLPLILEVEQEAYGEATDAMLSAAPPDDPNDMATPFGRGYNLGLHHGLSRAAPPEPPLGMHDGDHECRLCGLTTPVGAAPERLPSVEAISDAINAQAELLACYRIGKHPSGKLLDRVGRANELRASLRASLHEAAPPEPPLDVERRARLLDGLNVIRDFSTDTASRALADSLLALLDEASAAPPEPPLDYDRMVEAGFLDAYLNIAGVEDEARAEELLREDIARYDEMGGAAPERLPVAPHPFIGEQRSPTHCLLFIEGGVTCKQPPDAPVHQP